MTKYLPVNYRLDRNTFWYVGQSNVQRDRVTKYFDICSNVIFHWYGKQKKREGFKGNIMREGKRKLRGLQREEANSESSEIT